MHFSAKCNSGRFAKQWFHIKHCLDYPYTKIQLYTSRVQKNRVFARYATLVPRLYAIVLISCGRVETILKVWFSYDTTASEVCPWIYFIKLVAVGPWGRSDLMFPKVASGVPSTFVRISRSSIADAMYLRPNKKISVFQVMGLKILGRVGTHNYLWFFFSKKHIILRILTAFHISKWQKYPEKPEKI